MADLATIVSTSVIYEESWGVCSFMVCIIFGVNFCFSGISKAGVFKAFSSDASYINELSLSF